MNQTNSPASFKEILSRNKYALIIPIILVVAVGNFIIQLPFVSEETIRNINLSAEKESVVELKNPQTEPLIVESDLPQTETPESDTIVSPKVSGSSKDIIKVVQKDSRRPSETKPVQNNLKKEAKDVSKNERLRRAEKLLTGF